VGFAKRIWFESKQPDEEVDKLVTIMRALADYSIAAVKQGQIRIRGRWLCKIKRPVYENYLKSILVV